LTFGIYHNVFVNALTCLFQHLTDEKPRRYKSSLHKIRTTSQVRWPWLHHEAWLRRWDKKTL